ncbi:MAG: Mov34/MPN/PAD-1 family protein [Bacteroidales bacterium]
MRQAVLDDLVAHASQEAPRECCGILVGSTSRIERSFRARNLLKSATRYVMDPEDQFAAIRFAREAGLAVVGFYHSHPASDPVPSETDRREAEYPNHWYLIVRPAAGERAAEVRGFLLEESGNFLPIALVPTP